MSSVKEVQSVSNACVVVEAVAEHQPVGVSDLARVTGIDKSAVHRLAVTLHSAGWLERSDDGRWSVAPALGVALRRSAVDALVASARPFLVEGRDRSGETAMLVLAGSHRCTKHWYAWGEESDLPAVVIETEPGDLTLHYGDTMHTTPPPTADGAGRRALYFKVLRAAHLRVGTVRMPLQRRTLPSRTRWSGGQSSHHLGR